MVESFSSLPPDRAAAMEMLRIAQRHTLHLERSTALFPDSPVHASQFVMIADWLMTVTQDQNPVIHEQRMSISSDLVDEWAEAEAVKSVAGANRLIAGVFGGAPQTAEIVEGSYHG